MELVYDHHVEVRRVEASKVKLSQGLNGTEDVAPFARTLPTDI
jgi:hypothetical protein